MFEKPSSPKKKLDKVTQTRIGELLLEGHDSKEIVSQLEKAGYSLTLARTEVHKAANSPYLQSGQIFKQRQIKRDWVLNSLSKLQRMRPEAKGVLTIAAEKLNPQIFFTNFYTTNTPLLIKGMVKHWPAMNKWSLDYFEEKAGDNKVEVQFGRSSRADYEIRKDALKKVMPFREFLTLMRKSETTNDYYITASNSGMNGKALQVLWEDTAPLDGYLTGVQGEGFFWMGPKGTLTPFHHDLTNNFLLQIFGRKRVVLSSAVEISRMRNFEHCFSAWGTRPDEALAQNPAVRPSMVECVIEPGDILFIPVGWWHFVEGLDMTFGMSFTNFVLDNDFHSFYSSYQRV